MTEKTGRQRYDDRVDLAAYLNYRADELVETLREIDAGVVPHLPTEEEEERFAGWVENLRAELKCVEGLKRRFWVKGLSRDAVDAVKSTVN